MTIQLSETELKPVIELTIKEMLSQQQSASLMPTIEYYKLTRKEVAICDIASILRGEGKLNRNGTNLVEQRLKELQSEGKLTAINAHGQRNLFKMSDIYILFFEGHFDGLK